MSIFVDLSPKKRYYVHNARGKAQSEKPKNMEDKNMVSYNEALRRAKAAKPNWNEEEYITGATITWADADYEYELEIENDGYGDEEFEAWIEKNAEELAKKDAAEQGTIFEELLGIDYETETYDDDAAFDDEYDNYLEFEWECRTGR